jgi:predicted nucleotidyltransferase
MAKVSDTLIEKIKLFVKELEKEKLTISKVFLFGSYARNQQNEWSDIDIAVVSDDFTGNRMNDYDKCANAILKVDRSIEPIPYKTENFTSDNPFANEIITTGIRII